LIQMQLYHFIADRTISGYIERLKSSSVMCFLSPLLFNIYLANDFINVLTAA